MVKIQQFLRIKNFATDIIRDTMKGVWLKGLPNKATVIVLGQEYVTDGVEVQQIFQEVKN